LLKGGYMNRLAKQHPALTFFNNNGIGRNLFLFDSIFDGFEDFFKDVKFPKYNVLTKDDDLELEVALAGYKKDELSLELSPDNILTLSADTGGGITEDPDELGYIYRGIASRNFKISWKIGTSFEIGDITYENGMLRIPLNGTTPKEPDVKTLSIK